MIGNQTITRRRRNGIDLDHFPQRSQEANIMSSKIKETEEFNRLWDKYGWRTKKTRTEFLSEWQDWSAYRRWQELEGLR